MSARQLERARVTAYPTSPPWHSRLGLRLALLWLLLGAGTAIVAWLAVSKLVGAQIEDEALRYEYENTRRVAAQLDARTAALESASLSLAALAGSTPGQWEGLRAAVTAMIRAQPAAGDIIAFGLWPKPFVVDPHTERASLYWTREDGDDWRIREDYNNPRAIPYFREKWFTPAQYARGNTCYWTPVYGDPLLRQDVLTCAAPVNIAGRFAGVTTVTVAADTLARWFADATRGDTGYAILLDRDNGVVGLSNALADSPALTHRPRNMAELAQNFPSLGPVAVAVHGRAQASAQAVAADPGRVRALAAETRDLSLEEAASALASLLPAATGLQQQLLPLPRDSLVGGPVQLLVSDHGSGWRIARAVPLFAGYAGAPRLVRHALLLTLTATLLALLLTWTVLHFAVVAPLRRMATADRGTPASGTLRRSDEVGILARAQQALQMRLDELRHQVDEQTGDLQAERAEKAMAQRGLVGARALNDVLFGSTGDAVLMTDLSGRIEDMNAAAERLLATTLAAARGRRLAEILSLELADSDDDPLEMIKDALPRGKRLDLTQDLVLRMGTTSRPVQLSAVAVSEGDSNRAVLVFHAPGTLGGVAESIDSTAVRPRARLERHVQSLIERAKLSPREHGLLYFNIDHLGRVNERFGQPAGDALLIHVAGILEAGLPESSLHHLAADRYAAVVEGFDSDAAIKLAERLRASVASSPLRWAQRDVPATVSVGVVSVSAQSGTGFDVLRRAEDACRAAKESGRNQVRVFEGHMQRGPDRGDDEIWVQRVRRGLKRNLFHLTTQWVECAAAHRREGDVFETLIALEDEEGFWATALQFLPAAERHALASELDTWTLARTLEVLDGQREDMDRLAFCGINLSSQSAAQPEWLDTLVDALQRHPRVPPSKLCFELRQDVFLQDINHAARFCDTLRALGCRVAVDHFIGRRTDDLALLRRIPADFIKVDARHFPHVATDGAERLVAEGVIKLAHTLKRRVMVSHIESEDQLAVWRNLEGNYFQGFAVSRPSPVVFARPG